MAFERQCHPYVGGRCRLDGRSRILPDISLASRCQWTYVRRRLGGKRRPPSHLATCVLRSTGSGGNRVDGPAVATESCLRSQPVRRKPSVSGGCFGVSLFLRARRREEPAPSAETRTAVGIFSTGSRRFRNDPPRRTDLQAKASRLARQ